MKIAIVHNEYGKFSGEEAVVRDQTELLRSHGHHVIQFTRSSAEISKMFMGKLRAFFCGIYNPFSVLKFRKFLKSNCPDIVHIHNLYPFISPAILSECKKLNVPVVMSVHNYRLICPNGLFMSRNGICEKCSGGKELNCIRYNCENSLFKSTGYALRNWFARKKRYYLDNVDIFATLTEFQRQKLIEHGFPEEKVALLPNMNKMESESNNKQGDYVAYVGRLSREKGIDLIVSAASKLPQIKFRMAGHGAEQFRENAPSNLEFCGCLSGSELDKFYSNCRFLVMTSLWYETFGLVAVEAMFHGKAVIASDIGVLPEVIGGNEYGMTFNPENIDDFIYKVEYLWDNPKYSTELGKKACERALLIYSPKVYYKKLMTIYKQNL